MTLDIDLPVEKCHDKRRGASGGGCCLLSDKHILKLYQENPVSNPAPPKVFLTFV